MTAKELRKKYIDFFVKKGHKRIPSASLVPENDPTALFISAGMHPLISYLMGESHPMGKRLVDVQKCLRVNDIEEVGDVSHHTFLEMLGNWSLGDYWKKEAIEWSYEFLTKELNLEPKRLSVTCFSGDQDAPQDKESYQIWLSVGIPKERIYFLGKEDNWWGPVGQTGPCGPDTEIFYDIGKPTCSSKCQPGCSCGKYFEIWNNVFMEFNCTKEGKYEPLKQKNVDTGMGVERTAAILQGKDDNYQTELFGPIIEKIESLSGKSYQKKENKKPIRIIVDHLRAASFVIADGVLPTNKDQGYILRRLIRRAVRFGKMLAINKVFTVEIAKKVIEIMGEEYSELKKREEVIFETLNIEEGKFGKTLERGLKEIEKYKNLDGKIAFYLYETYGLPLEMIQEIAQEKGQKIKKQVFEKEFTKHQALSRKGAKKKFSGGLADHSEMVTRLHTATHLLHRALREVLGSHVQQSGSNITAERLRFDFSHSEKLTPEEIKKVEELVNEKIKQNLKVFCEVMTLEQAKKSGALAFFEKKYEEKVKVYSIGDWTKEVCGGPHVDFTSALGKFRIKKEESAGAGIRRIYGILE
ncbi:alanine--tRNA ligase [Candidatus Microgenomates bacterium]|nr:alanine--tRNA ligase [Candidatus Microgenomates bacterium]